jgi:transcriptional regulator with XRE-family HTH domain
MLGKKLRRLRKANGLTQQDLADILELSKSVVCNYELGSRIPKLSTLIKVAELFDCSVDYLLGRTDNCFNK